MGILPSASYQTTAKTMDQGDLIMLFTDGLFEVEGRGGEIFTQEQLYDTVNTHMTLPPEQFFAHVLDDVRKFSDHGCFEDDVCVVGVQVQRTD